MKKTVAAWQHALQDVITTAEELFTVLQLQPTQVSCAYPMPAHFKLRVPRAFVERMQLGDPNDPLLLQVLPQAAERSVMPGYTPDPLHEQAQNPVPGLLHKYQGRVLLTLTGACGIHCRYCFRQHFPYADNHVTAEKMERIVAYVQQDPSIHEIILSGGDPLTWSDEKLQALIQHLSTIPHVTTLRIHTRLPVVIPARMTTELLTLLAETRLHVVVVLHSNHPNELTPDVLTALQRFKPVTHALFNQAVLLKQVNDSVDALALLSRRLFSAGVLPYYLHMLDPVQGTAHFAVAEEKARALLKSLMARLPGYLVPKLVREVAGEKHKVHLL